MSDTTVTDETLTDLLTKADIALELDTPTRWHSADELRDHFKDEDAELLAALDPGTVRSLVHEVIEARNYFRWNGIS